MDINAFGHNSFVYVKGLKEKIEEAEMTEHLFKLKKDGKTVGYAHINGYGQLMFRLPDDSDWWCKDKFWQIMIKKYGFGIPPCSYHPFVTKDKNGKDVFAEDEILLYDDQKARVEQLGTALLRYGVRYWDSQRQIWFNFISSDKFFKNEDIELIEDKEDD